MCVLVHMYQDKEMVENAIDMHIHPIKEKKGMNLSVPLTIEAVEEMNEAGMAGTIIKPHWIETTLLAQSIDHQFSDFKVFGGFVMDRPAGGIDPYVVEELIDQGAKKFWMPLMTKSYWDKQLAHPQGYVDEEAYNRMEKRFGPFWTYLNEDGEIREDIRSDLRDVLEIIAENDVIFDTGHASPEESLVLIDEANEAGVDKIVVDHPLSMTIDASLDQQKEMVEKGAYLEHSWAKMQPTGGGTNPKLYAESMKEVGAENTILVTDYAALYHPPPSEAMREYIVTMKHHGITDSEIEQMIKDNPRELLDL